MHRTLRVIVLTSLIGTAGYLTGCAALTDKSQVPQPNGTTNTVYSVKPIVADVLTTAQGVAPLVPPPWNAVVTLTSSLTAAGLALYLKRKNGEATTASTILGSIIQTVEALPPTTTQQAVKTAISDAALAKGVADPLAALVAHHTA